jgi:hypothetical protein
MERREVPWLGNELGESDCRKHTRIILKKTRTEKGNHWLAVCWRTIVEEVY